MVVPDDSGAGPSTFPIQSVPDIVTAPSIVPEENNSTISDVAITNGDHCVMTDDASVMHDMALEK